MKGEFIMLKKNKKRLVLFFSISLICVAVYGNVEFLKGHIFAETAEESNVPETEKINSDENTRLEKTAVESQANSQQVNKATKESTEDGWVATKYSDFIEEDGNKISWKYGESWYYRYNNNSWIDGDLFYTHLIVNDSILTDGTKGFVWANQAGSQYAKNPTTNTLRRSFEYQSFQIVILQQLLDDGAVVVSYQVTNKASVAKKIGVYQRANLSDKSSVQVLNGFKGLNVASSSLALMPDSETMPNWSAGVNGRVSNFDGYNPNSVNGVGWESGKKQPNSSVDLKENKALYLGNTDVVMKNPGSMVQPNESTTFKQIVKLGRMVPPVVTLDQKNMEMYKNESIDITGTIFDSNNHNYRLYLEMDDLDKTLFPLKDFTNIPYHEVQNYQVTIEGKHFKKGDHSVSIIGIDEYGARSVVQKLSLTIKEISGTPLVQKVKIGDNIQADITKLFANIVGNELKLKSISQIDSTTVGFQWADVVLIDADLKEESFKIPVAVYDAETTTFNDIDHLVLDVKDNLEITMSEVSVAVRENRLNELIFQKSEAKAWQAENGEAVTIEVAHNVGLQFGKHEVTIKAIRKDTNKVHTKRISLFITDGPLKDGWESVSSDATVSKDEYKIEWKQGSWWYTFNGNSWIYNNFLETSLIINGVFPAGTSDGMAGYNPAGQGFLRKKQTESIYSIQRETNSLRRTFQYLDRYKIDITQRLLENNGVEITYQVTNFGSDTQKIGLSQFSATFVGSASYPVVVTPINNFKGINLTYDGSSMIVIPDPETMPNWAAGQLADKFQQYNVQNSSGVGWETGKRYRNDSGGLLYPPTVLKENKPVRVSNTSISMKNQGVDIASNESTSFKQIWKYGVLAPPKVTLNQTKASMYRDQKVEIDGTISDEDNMDYRVYLELDDKDKTLVPLADYTNIPYNEVQTYQGTIDGKLFSPGIHTVSVIGIDEYGTRSAAQNIELTITELDATPDVQKVKLGEALSNDLNILFKEVKGTNVTLKPLSMDSSVVGFQWIEATLTDGKRDVIKKIPVNVYNAESTLFNEKDAIALDAKDTFFDLVDVRKNSEEGTLDELVRQKVEPKAWDMADGTTIPIELITNEIEPAFGIYSATFKATKEGSGGMLQKNSQLSVGGELKFKELPKNLDYKTTKLSQKTPYVERIQADWKIEIENTIGSNWSLFASAVSFEDQAKQKLRSALILKQNQIPDLVISEISQKIATGSETYPMIQWAETAGLLLKVSPDAKVGNYQGEITWLLSDAP